MYTFQDFASETSPSQAVQDIINDWTGSELFQVARSADLYDRQQNETIMNYVQTIFSMSGSKIEDFTASNSRICSNFFHRLNTQRCTYSLGNGVTFPNDKSGAKKKKLGPQFDTVLMDAGYHALIHGLSFLYFNSRVYEFMATEFAPLWDEYTGELKAGVRFWQLAPNKPILAVLYEEDGYTKFKKDSDSAGFVVTEEKRKYILRVQSSEADGEEIIGGENYSSLPIVPLWGSKLQQSTLVGMRQAIDSFDLIRSGFANDLTDCAQIYWILENYGGMNEDDLARFRDRMKLHHIAEMNTEGGGKITPYTQEIPYQARKQYLDDMRNGIYEDFGALDVHTVAAGATNDHIDAAYQPMDENADDFEGQVIKAVQRLGVLVGMSEEDAIPTFKRNRISNQKEQVEMLMLEAQYLDEETILNKLPNITVDEVQEILKRKDAEDQQRMFMGGNPPTTDEEQQNEEEEEQNV